MDTVDALARALANAIWGGSPLAEDAFELLSDGEQETYRRWARAAIDALGLTEEWGTSPDNTDAEGNPLYEPKGPVTYGDTESQAREHAARFNGHPWSRLVSGWVRKDNTNE